MWPQVEDNRSDDGGDGERMNTLTVITLMLAILFGFSVYALWRLYRIDEDLDLHDSAIVALLELHPELLADDEEGEEEE